MAMDFIRIRGARTHNLKNIDLDLPRDKLIVITGLSGSGKSSLAFDTIYAEGQRRYVESLSAYARQFLSVMEKPDVDHRGLSPAISIEQKSTSHNPRSTVGTITEIYDYLRLLYARVGTRAARTTAIRWKRRRSARWSTRCWRWTRNSATCWRRSSATARASMRRCSTSCAQGFVRVRVDGELHEIDAVPPLALRQKHTIEAVIDRFRPREDIKQRLAESFETALKLGDGMASVRAWTSRRRPCSPPSIPARSATTRCRSWNRACSRSTHRWAPAPAAMAWAWPNSSIRARGGAPDCRWPPARCAAGTAATPTTSS
jgi:excinuclease ABC subunit A